jgi:acetyl-CoA carboxylase biotin carboxyl carrier protein
VAEDLSPSPRPFDVRTVRYLVALMRKHDLSEIDLCEGDRRIRLRRGGSTVAAAPAPAAVPAPTPAAALTPAPAEAERKPASTFIPIKAPTPGTFYSAPSPGAEPFVRVGSRVTPTTVVGLIEAMKLFNEIPADCTGVVAEVLVENQQPVEYGQVLFHINPAG